RPPAAFGRPTGHRPEPGPRPWCRARLAYFDGIGQSPEVTEVTEFHYQDMLPLGPDETSYRLLTTDGVSTFEADGHRFLRIDPQALTDLTAEAMREIAHYLRPAHLQQLRTILDDADASANDRFVALDLLKNACISAGGVLPMCQ